MTYKEATKKSTNKVANELRKLWIMIQMLAKTTGAVAILYCAVKHIDSRNLQYALAVIASVLLFSVIWNIYCLLSDD